jgi:hypothetical protein
MKASLHPQVRCTPTSLKRKGFVQQSGRVDTGPVIRIGLGFEGVGVLPTKERQFDLRFGGKGAILNDFPAQPPTRTVQSAT